MVLLNAVSAQAMHDLNCHDEAKLAGVPGAGVVNAANLPAVGEARFVLSRVT